MPVIRRCSTCGQKNRVAAKHLADTGRCGACKSALPALAEPLAADATLFDEILADATVPVLVDFWAAWCGPCRAAAPEVAKTAADMAGKAVILKVDTEASPELAARYQVRGIPNFAVISGGKMVFQQAGLVGHEVMEGWIRDAARPIHRIEAAMDGTPGYAAATALTISRENAGISSGLRLVMNCPSTATS